MYLVFDEISNDFEEFVTEEAALDHIRFLIEEDELYEGDITLIKGEKLDFTVEHGVKVRL